MSSYWRVVPTFRLARQLCRDTYGSLAAHRYIRDRYFDGMFRAMPSATHSELRKTLYEAHKKHWKEFARGMEDSFGVKTSWNQDATTENRATEHRDCTNKATGVRDQMNPSTADVDAPVSQSTRGFEVALDLSGFTPEEISVRIIGNTLRVEARHESESNGSHVLRSYKREFVLPADADLDALKSSLNAQGMLNLTAPGRGVAERAVRIDVASELDGDDVKDGMTTPTEVNETAGKSEDNK